MKKLMLAICLLVMSGCGMQWNGAGDLYSSQKNWDELKAKADNATSWDDLPYPWLIKSRGLSWVRDQSGLSYKNAEQVLNAREAEMYRFLKIVNEKRRQWYVKEHPELPAQTAKCILDGRLQIGMNGEQVMASWGHHGSRINQSVGNWGVHEQWIYGEYDPTYLYFEDGILTSWQE